MKKYFELRFLNRDDIGSLYSLDTSGGSTKINEVKEAIRKDLLSSDSEILMEVDPKSGTGKKRLGDIVFWQKGSPNAHVLIISRRFADFLKSLNTPKYKLYKVKIVNLDEGEYFIFHLLGDSFDMIDYHEQIFFKKNVMNDTNEGYIGKGTFSSKEKFMSERAMLIESKSQTLSFDTVIYAKEYDLLWGFSTLILVNETLKEKIKQQSFLLDFKEFNKYIIDYTPQS
jgi:hypothetical protein